MWKAKSPVVASGDEALCKAAGDRAVPDDRRAGEGAPRRFVGDYRQRREGAADIVYPVRYSLSNVVYFFAGLTFLRNAADGVNFTV